MHNPKKCCNFAAANGIIMAKIGVFDSGYGGLTILEKMRHLLPQYDYIYLGDNARTPYGTRSFEVIYEYTWQCVKHLFEEENALLVIQIRISLTFIMGYKTAVLPHTICVII